MYGGSGGEVRLDAVNETPDGTGAMHAQYCAGMVATTELSRTTRSMVGVVLQLSSRLRVPLTAGAMNMDSASAGDEERCAEGIGDAMWMTCVMESSAAL